MGYGGGPAARNVLVQDGLRLRLSDLTDGKPLRPHTRLRGSLTWSWSTTGEERASLRYELSTDATSGTIRLLYTVTPRAGGEALSMDYVIGLVTTEQPGGGVRWWLWCDRGRAMCSVVYMMPGSAVFASRQVFRRVSYRSQRVSDRDRHLEKAQAIRASLGGSVNLFEAFPEKPPRMWWSTYARKRQKAEAAGGASLALLNQHLDMIGFQDRAWGAGRAVSVRGRRPGRPVRRQVGA